ncbi:MAG: 3-phosphoshikimate 1-carboxyvinyltransferase [Bacteroidales bacterium]|jgi:3-phosphoshikimate 1-carboxyvinyltransferase|nr:3-phosphoshikimate 1-carboxyvinyltransferase [Bacteroidales bacterium]
MNILPPALPLKGKINLPASKSISNRLLIMQYLSNSRIRINNLSKADDTVLMRHLLKKVKANIDTGNSENVCLLNCENAGTVLRFLLALLSSQSGKWLLTGSERMKQRPVGSLVRALKTLGANIEYDDLQGFPPVKISGKNLTGNSVTIDASQSSQYITALMMIAPILEKGLTIRLENEIASQPYIEMTKTLMIKAGIDIKTEGRNILISRGSYKSGVYYVEPDWSAASYWYEAVALTPGSEIMLDDLSGDSVQGDAILINIFNALGVKTRQTDNGIVIQNINKAVQDFEFDFTNYPDLAPAVAATCTALNIEARLNGLKNLKIKESNRFEALHKELSFLNPGIDIINDEYLFIPKQKTPVKTKRLHFRTYHDHRMAMAFAPLASVIGEISIEDPKVVSKSYPGFWEEFQRSGFKVRDKFQATPS